MKEFWKDRFALNLMENIERYYEAPQGGKQLNFEIGELFET